MSAKADKKLRREIRKQARESVAVQATQNPDGLAARCERLERICRTFKAREGRLTVALVALSVAYKKQDTIAVNKFIGDMLRDFDLLENCHRVMSDRDIAMKIACEALSKTASEDRIRIGMDLGKISRTALDAVAKLDPYFLYAHGEDIPSFQDLPS